MIEFNNLESEPGWETHVGPDIGGVTPDNYGFHQYPPYQPNAGDPLIIPGEISFWCQGKPYSDCLSALHLPIETTALPAGKLSLMFELMVDANTERCAQALEFDTRLSVNKLNYNFSSQINYAEGGMFQISDENDKWKDTGIVLTPSGKLHPWNRHFFRYDYLFEIAPTSQYCLHRVWFNGKEFDLPYVMLPTKPLGWADSLSLQVQQDLNANGGAVSQTMRGVKYVWG